MYHNISRSQRLKSLIVPEYQGSTIHHQLLKHSQYFSQNSFDLVGFAYVSEMIHEYSRILRSTIQNAWRHLLFLAHQNLNTIKTFFWPTTCCWYTFLDNSNPYRLQQTIENQEKHKTTHSCFADRLVARCSCLISFPWTISLTTPALD